LVNTELDGNKYRREVDRRGNPWPEILLVNIGNFMKADDKDKGK
jgi:hypothetical protein